jgi:hypothetical protein
MYIPVWLVIIIVLLLVWQAGLPRPTMAEYRAEQEARQRYRAARRARKRSRLQAQRRRQMAIIRTHPWHTAIVSTLLVIAGVLFWSVPPKVNPKAEPAWQAWPIGIIAWILVVYLWRFETLTKEGKTDGEP